MAEHEVGFTIRARSLVSGAIKATQDGIKSIDKDLKALGVTSKGIKKSNEEISRSFMAVGVTGAAIVAPIGFAIHEAGKMETGIAKLAFKMNKTIPEAAGMFDESVKRIAGSTGFSEEVILSTLSGLITEGSSAADAIKLLETTSKGAVAGFGDLGTNTSAVKSILKTYKMDVSEAARVQDMLLIGAQGTAGGIDALGTAIKDVTGITSAYKIPAEEMIAAISTLTGGDRNTEAAGAAFKGVIVGLSRVKMEGKALIDILNANVSKDKQVDFSTIGIRKAGGLIPWLENVKAITKGSPYIMEQLFRFPETRKAMSDLTDRIDLLKSKTADLSGATEDGGKTALFFGQASGTTEQQLKTMKVSIGQVADEIGTTLLPFANKMIDKFKGITSTGKEFIKNNPKLVSGLGEMALAFGGILTVVGGLGLALMKISEGFIAIRAASLSLFASPAGLIALGVLGVVGAGYALYKEGEKTYSESHRGEATSAVRTDTGASVLPGPAGGDLFAQAQYNQMSAAAQGATLKGQFKFGAAQVNAVKDKNAAILTEEEKATAKILKELEKRGKGGAQGGAYYLGTGLKRGSLLTGIFQSEQAETGKSKIGEKLEKLIGGAKNTGGIIIQKLELPNVTNPGEFIMELNKLAGQTGIA